MRCPSIFKGERLWRKVLTGAGVYILRGHTLVVYLHKLFPGGVPVHLRMIQH